MRLLFSLLAAGFLSISFVGTSTLRANETSMAEGEEDLSKPMTHTGEILKVNPIKGTFTVEGRSFELSNSAQIYVDHIKKTLNEFKDGDKVEVVYFFRKTGIHRAVKLTRIQAGEPKPPK
jgi:hypothetical protein